MPNQEGTIEEWHRTFGASSFNATSELIEQSSRTPDEDLEMLLSAAASRWHKGFLGEAETIWLGDWQVAHVTALLGYGDLSLAFARRALTTAEAEGWDGWRLASSHECMARACSVAGDRQGRDRHVEAARQALGRERDEDERDAVQRQLDTVPEV